METFKREGKLNAERLVALGYARTEGGYFAEKPILGGQLVLRAEVTDGGEIRTRVLDPLTEEPYTLHLVAAAEGAFVGSVREAYGEELDKLFACFERSGTFTLRQTEELLVFARKTYGDEAEFLWERFPDCAVLRRKDSGNWYAAILTVMREKIGAGTGKTEVADFRMDPAELDRLADGKLYFRGYHMNKKNWATVVLDGSVENGELFARIRESYRLAAKH